MNHGSAGVLLALRLEPNFCSLQLRISKCDGHGSPIPSKLTLYGTHSIRSQGRCVFPRLSVYDRRTGSTANPSV
jgi:hypothetical protein